MHSVQYPALASCLAALSFPQKEEYHTRLALLYLDEVLQQRPSAGSPGTEATETQAKLRRLLQKSDLYRVHFLLGEQQPASLSPTCHSALRGGGGAGEGPTPRFDGVIPWASVGAKAAFLEGGAKRLKPPPCRKGCWPFSP